MAEPHTEPEPEAAEGAAPVVLTKGSRRSFSNVRRDLTEEDLKSPAVQKMLLDDTDRLAEELKEAKDFQEKFRKEANNFQEMFHQADKQQAILTEKLKPHSGFEVMAGGCLAVGGAALGYAPSIWSAQQNTSILLLIFGAIVLLAGLAAKALRL